ncbi:MAG: hypothetical protein HWD58_07350 [Bacteroidota bacterium]|nr:MAG: hypothetical protein HWD58_07350 [Bacteroidota bacterium]
MFNGFFGYFSTGTSCGFNSIPDFVFGGVDGSLCFIYNGLLFNFYFFFGVSSVHAASDPRSMKAIKATFTFSF